MRTILRDLGEDFEANAISGKGSRTLIKGLLTPKAWALVLVRVVIREVPLLSTMCRFILNMVFHVEIGARVTIGSRIYLAHPTDIVIASGTEIGDDCAIYHRTTFAEKGGVHKGPRIGNRCIIGTGTVIVGNINIGESVSIGPNSVVIKDIPPYFLAYGNPVQIQPKRLTDVQAPQSPT